MNKTSQILLVLFTGVVSFVTFFLTGNLASLCIGIASIGMLLQIFGEKILSRIIMVVGAIGASYFGIVTIVNVIKALM
ncbi:MAG: hypothetical protein IJX97_05940 [Clostridia bacterium]|nr:hypothetical protein [Clostridia bacterium]